MQTKDSLTFRHKATRGAEGTAAPQICFLSPKSNKHHFSSYRFTICIVGAPPLPKIVLPPKKFFPLSPHKKMRLATCMIWPRHDGTLNVEFKFCSRIFCVNSWDRCDWFMDPLPVGVHRSIPTYPYIPIVHLSLSYATSPGGCVSGTISFC